MTHHKIFFWGSILTCILLILNSCKQRQDVVDQPSQLTDTTIAINKTIREDIQMDSSVLDYIEKQKHYIALNDYATMPEEIKSCYTNIKLFLYENNMDINSYFIDKKAITIKENKLTIPLYHYSGFEQSKDIDEMKKTNTAEGPMTIVTGNLSGKDGTLAIDTKTNSVISFLLWQ